MLGGKGWPEGLGEGSTAWANKEKSTNNLYIKTHLPIILYENEFIFIKIAKIFYGLFLKWINLIHTTIIFKNNTLHYYSTTIS